MSGDSAALCFTSPPYLQQRRYISGISDWDQLMEGAFRHPPLTQDAQLFVNLGPIHKNNEEVMYWEHWREWMRSQGWLFRYQLPWDKGFGLPGRFTHFAPAHEYILHFAFEPRQPNKIVRKRPQSIRPLLKAPGLRGVDGESSRRSVNPETSLATHKIPDSVVRIGRSNVHTEHPAAFPPELPKHFALSYSNPDDIIFEPFCGSGSTVIAAERCGRRCYALELEPNYVDMALARILKETKIVPYRFSDAMPFGGHDWLHIPARPPVGAVASNDDLKLAA
jgi:DNA modification methylase